MSSSTSYSRKRSAPTTKGPAKKKAKKMNVRTGMLAPHGEIKYVDGYLDNLTLQALSANDATWASCEANPRQQTAVYGCLPVPRQGTNYADRDGRKIFVKKLRS